MKKVDFTLEQIKDNRMLGRLAETLTNKAAIALDIETTEWWNRQREKISLVQLAYRNGLQVKVAVIDAFVALDFDLLRSALEAEAITKVVHNAAFDVPRLAKYYAINAAPVFDTMRTARFNGERRYSLAAQSNAHLNLQLDKSFQKIDWSCRPLSAGQLYYAAADAYAALLLYENQINRGLSGGYHKKPADSRQVELPLDDFPKANALQTRTIQSRETVWENDLPDLSLALLGIVTELPTRYSPDALAASVGIGRVGLTGWIIDRRLGTDADLDEETVKLTIADLCARQYVQLNETRRLIPTGEGIKWWRKFKND
ncbi:MAG TPA: hypothetical protein VK308_03965 [Pyrinomonadaceae bacterium]|nr:hypothetical protein [Pyrinomonadaceae bacterium]